MVCSKTIIYIEVQILMNTNVTINIAPDKLWEGFFVNVWCYFIFAHQRVPASTFWHPALNVPAGSAVVN
jgi:hypothetical protein